MNTNTNITKAWREYEAGKDYKRRIGLYETVRRNERFYRGDQWRGSEGVDLPKPVFNIIKRVTDYLVCSVATGNYSLAYTDENMPFYSSKSEGEAIKRGLDVMTKNARYRWERCRMDSTVYGLLLDAAISGDGVAYCYWDSAASGDREFSGDIGAQRIDNINLFVADVNNADIQSQEYVMLAGRESVESLRREARENGAEERAVMRIVPDEDNSEGYGTGELEDGMGKATCLIKFHREGGFVVFEKCTKECVIKRVETRCRLYPVAFFNWTPTKNSIHGAAPISSMVPNQKFINRAYAMVMKHMTDTAFSKVVYDKSRIPEWTNEVGEAIAVVGATNVSDAVSVVGVGKMQENYLELIENAVSTTKELMGATETALGNIVPTNTSAILALKETSKVTLAQVTSAACRCIEDIANIWADMMCAYYSNERLVPFVDGEETIAGKIDFDALRGSLIRARVEVGEATTYSASTALSILDKLLDGGYISAQEYVEHLPEGFVIDREMLVKKGETEDGRDDDTERA